MAAVVVLSVGIGMLFGGGIADWLSRGRPRYRAIVPAAYALISGLMLAAAFALPPGLAGLALFIGGGVVCCRARRVCRSHVDRRHQSAVHATVTATAVLGASLLGMAPGPYLVGMLSDVANL